MARQPHRIVRSRKYKRSVAEHPYAKYMSSPLWRIVSGGIRDLVKNGDLRELSPRDYIVGYLCKMLARQGRSKLG